MADLFVGLAVASAVAVVALIVRVKRTVDAPTQRRFPVPLQIDRADFGAPDSEWLITVFTSASCPVCADVSAKVHALASRNVATRAVDYDSDRELHQKYEIEAVPAVLIADASGVVLHHILGPVSAADLWAAVAAIREGSDPVRGQCQEH